MKLIRTQLKNQWAGFLALFLVITSGTAYAVAAKNSVNSKSIINQQVKTADLASGAVSGAKLKPGSVTSDKLANGSVGGSAVANGSIGPDDVAGLLGSNLQNNTVTGTKINESTLDKVPSAARGGTGRYAFQGSCDPEAITYVPCSYINPVTLAAPSRVLAIGTVEAHSEDDADDHYGSCQLSTDGVADETTRVSIYGDHTNSISNLTVMTVTPVLGTGDHVISVECNQYATGAITFWKARLVTVVLSDS